MPARDYYVVLGVSRHESPSAIRAAYHELAKRFHPDVSGGAGTAFQEINEAYSVLSDPERRRLYDQRLAGAVGVPIPVRRTAPVEPLSPEPISILGSPERTRPSFDAFQEWFGANFTGRNVPKSERVESLTLDLVLSPAEALLGCSLPVGIPGFYACKECGGSGHLWMFPCAECRGSGMVEKMRTLWVRVPGGVRPGTVLEYPLNHFGVRNLYVRVRVSISDSPRF
jgi:DnaJ-class molecular chaperone